MHIVREIAYEFLLECKIKEPLRKIERLESIAKDRGWDIYPYSRAGDLISTLHLEDFKEKYKGFTYINQDIVIIFYSDRIPYDDKLFVIAHEIGHLYLHHTFAGTVTICDDIDDQEKEANVFACEILLPLPILRDFRRLGIQGVVNKDIAPAAVVRDQMTQLHDHKIYLSMNAKGVRKNWRRYVTRTRGVKRYFIIGITAACVVLTIALAVPKYRPTFRLQNPVIATTATKPKPPEDDYAIVYGTEHGERYHARIDCPALKNAKTTIYEYEHYAAVEEGKTPCSICYDLVN